MLLPELYNHSQAIPLTKRRKNIIPRRRRYFLNEPKWKSLKVKGKVETNLIIIMIRRLIWTRNRDLRQMRR
jgi:hypothetical protein